MDQNFPFYIYNSLTSGTLPLFSWTQIFENDHCQRTQLLSFSSGSTNKAVTKVLRCETEWGTVKSLRKKKRNRKEEPQIRRMQVQEIIQGSSEVWKSPAECGQAVFIWLSFNLTAASQSCREQTRQSIRNYSAHYKIFRRPCSSWSRIKMTWTQGSRWGQTSKKSERESAHRRIPAEQAR